MKKLLVFITFGAVLFPIVVTLTAQTNNLGIPPELLNKPLKEWQLNGITVLIVIQVLGRAYTALKNGGGLVGIWKTIAFGVTPPATPTITTNTQ